MASNRARQPPRTNKAQINLHHQQEGFPSKSSKAPEVCTSSLLHWTKFKMRPSPGRKSHYSEWNLASIRSSLKSARPAAIISILKVNKTQDMQPNHLSNLKVKSKSKGRDQANLRMTRNPRALRLASYNLSSLQILHSSRCMQQQIATHWSVLRITLATRVCGRVIALAPRYSKITNEANRFLALSKTLVSCKKWKKWNRLR